MPVNRVLHSHCSMNCSDNVTGTFELQWLLSLHGHQVTFPVEGVGILQIGKGKPQKFGHTLCEE